MEVDIGVGIAGMMSRDSRIVDRQVEICRDGGLELIVIPLVLLGVFHAELRDCLGEGIALA